MTGDDAIKFLSYLGVIQVNDITAKVTSVVTAAIDPEGMGAHMGAEVVAAAAAINPGVAGAAAGAVAVGGKRAAREDILFDLDVEERRFAMKREEATNEVALLERRLAMKIQADSNKERNFERSISNIQLWGEQMTVYDKDWQKDERLRMQTISHLQNLMFNSKCITDGGSSAESVQLESITVSTVAHDMGYHNLAHGDDVCIGRIASKRYKEKYGEPPSKHKQIVTGKTIMVNSYTERDRDLIEDAVREHVENNM